MSSLSCRQQVGVFVLNKPQTNMQSEFTALQGAIHDLMISKQEFEQVRTFKLNRYVIKIAKVEIE